MRVYLITSEGEGWMIETELQAFAFSDIEGAKKFVYDLPDLSAIDILIRMRGHQSNSPSGLSPNKLNPLSAGKGILNSVL